MNREIKFRAWDRKEMEMKRVLNISFISWSVTIGNIGDETTERNSFRNEETDRFILMQYTGLKDKHGTEIYEGDILRYRPYHNLEYRDRFDIHAVEWGETGDSDGYSHSRHQEWICGRDSLADVVDGECEVIGNIYENPKLLEKDGD